MSVCGRLTVTLSTITEQELNDCIINWWKRKQKSHHPLLAYLCRNCIFTVMDFFHWSCSKKRFHSSCRIKGDLLHPWTVTFLFYFKQNKKLTHSSYEAYLIKPWETGGRGDDLSSYTLHCSCEMLNFRPQCAPSWTQIIPYTPWC